MSLLQRQNSNKYRRYPFEDDSSFLPLSTKFNDGVLLELSMLSYGYLMESLTLHRYTIVDDSPNPRVCNLVFRPYPLISMPAVTVPVPENASFPYDIDLPYVVAGDVLSYRLRCVIGDGILTLFENPAGTYLFDNPPRVLDTRVIAMTDHRVDYLIGKTQNQSETPVSIRGDVFIEEGYNITTTIIPSTNTLVIGAALGAGKGVSCDVLDLARKPVDGIIAINGAIPDSKGNINIRAGNGISIDRTDDHVLTIKGTIDDNRIVCKE